MENGNKNGERMIAALTVIVIVASVAFLVTAGLTWVICWGFSRVWSWRLSVGVFGTMLIVFVTLRAGTRQIK